MDFRRTSGGHTYPREVANQRQKRTNPMKTLSPDRKFDDETSVKLHARRRACVKRTKINKYFIIANSRQACLGVWQDPVYARITKAGKSGFINLNRTRTNIIRFLCFMTRTNRIGNSYAFTSLSKVVCYVLMRFCLSKSYNITCQYSIGFLGQPLIKYIIYGVWWSKKRNNGQGLVWWVRRMLHNQPNLVFMV